MSQRTIDIILQLAKEIDERRIWFKALINEIAEASVADRADILEEMMDLLDSLNMRMTTYGDFIEDLKKEIDHPSISNATRQACKEHFNVYESLKMEIEGFEGFVMSVAN